jgi:hypothetical protein
MENMVQASSKIKLNFPDRILKSNSNVGLEDEIYALKRYMDVDSKINEEYFDIQNEHQKLNLGDLFSFIQDYLSI